MSTPIWISHRGLSQQYDENSQEAFKSACDAGFPWLETDLRCTKDNHIILCHDSKLDRVSSCSSHIAEMTRAELKKIQLKKGGNFLFLDEFIVEFNKQHWVFDVKSDTAVQTIKIISNLLIADKTLINKIKFLFWNKKLQENFLKKFPDAICFSDKKQCYQAGIATLLGVPMLGNIKKNKIYSIIPKLFGQALINKRVVQTFHKREAQVIGYLPATQAEVQLCLDAGVDYILSNDRPVNSSN